MSIKHKLMVVIAVMTLVVAVQSGVVWVTAMSKQGDGLAINVSGRQRMLTQRMTKEALQLMLTLAETGKVSKSHFHSLEVTRDVFVKSLDALINTGWAPAKPVENSKNVLVTGVTGPALDHLKELHKDWDIFEEQIERVAVFQDKEALAYVLANNIPLLIEMDKAVGMIQRQSDEKMYRMLVIVEGGLVVFCCIVAFSLFMIQRRIIRPLEEVSEYAHQVAGGNFETTLSGTYTSELLTLKNAIEDMVGTLNKGAELEEAETEAKRLATEARDAVERAQKNEAEVKKLLSNMAQLAEKAGSVSGSVYAACDTLNTKLADVTERSESQCGRIAETGTTIESMNVTVVEMSRNASSAVTSSEHARIQAEQGAEVVSRVIDAIVEINELTLKLNTEMESLGGKANDINQVINVINDIADQTNLLALNAAIEAARAGEAGRGFAVVADEVRKLAEKTMQATKEVEASIVAIQSSVETNIQHMDTAVSSVTSVKELSQESGEKLQDIVTHVNEATREISDISSASDEQAETSSEINLAIEEINHIALENSGSIQEAQATVQELTEQASELGRVIEAMKA